MLLPDLRRAVATTLLLTVGLAGCGLFGDDAAPTSSTIAPSTTTTLVPVVARREPPVLLDPGEEPRQQLRVAYTEGDEATITFTSDLEVVQVSTGRTQRLDSPPIAQTLSYTVGAVGAAGAALTIRIEALEVQGDGTGLDNDEIDRLEAALEPMVGFEAEGTVTPLGELIDLAFTLPDELPAELAAQLEALQSQLPALGPSLPTEPVGIGASWRSTAIRPAGGAEVQVTTTSTVTAIDDGIVRYRSSVTSVADPQEIQMDGVGEGTTVRLVSSDLGGSGTGSLGLNAVSLELRTRLGGKQELALTSPEATTMLTQQLAIAYVAVTAPS